MTQSPYVRVLGRTVLLGRGPGTPVRSPLQLRLLAAIAVAGPAGLTPEQAEDAVWGDDPPRTARQSLHNLLHRLRGLLGEEAIVWDGRRYQRDFPTDLDDLLLAAHAARRALASGTPAVPLDPALGHTPVMEGQPLEDLGTLPGLERMRQQVAAAREDLARATLASLRQAGRHEDAERWLEARLEEDPGREDLWVALMETRERSGRRNEALATFHRARRHLRDRLGLEPGPELERVQRRLLVGTRTHEPAPGLTEEVTPAALVAVMQALRDGPVVLLAGEAGIGKSTTLAAAARGWEGGPVHLVRCEENPWTALGPAHQLMEALGVDRPVPGVPGSGPAPPGRHTRAVQQGIVAEDVARAIARALAATPGALVALDDVDLAGPTTRQILVEALVGAGCRVLLTARDRDRAAGTWTPDATVALTGLDAEEVTVLVARLTGTPAADVHHAGWVHGLTGGHPMLVTEVVRDLSQREPGWATAPAQPTLEEVTPRLRTLLGRRLDDLSTRTRRALDVVAVLGTAADPALVAWLTDPSRLDPAVAAGILRRTTGGEVSFTHDLLRRVAYEEVPEGRRRELHHAIGHRTPDVEARAEHLLRAVELDPPAAVAAAAAAAEVGLRRQAYAEAADLFARAAAVAATHDMPERAVQLELEAADAARLAGRPGHADPLLEAAEAAMEADNVALRRRATLATLALGEVVDVGPTQQRAMVLAKRSLAMEDDPAWRARIGATASLLYSINDQHETCRELFTTARDTMSDDDHVAVDVLPYAYMALSHVEDLPEREAAADRLGDAAEAVDDDIGRFEAGHLAFSCALMRGDGHRARAVHRRMTALTATVGDAGRRWSLAYQQAALTVLDGDLEAAERANEAALSVGQGVAPARALAAFSGQLLEIRRLQGRVGELAPVLDMLLADQPEIAGWRAAGAMAHADADQERARSLFDGLADRGFVELQRDFAWLAGIMSLGRAAARMGDADRARKVVPLLEPHAELVCWQGTCTYGPVAEVLADLHDVIGTPRPALRDRAEALHESLGPG